MTNTQIIIDTTARQAANAIKLMPQFKELIQMEKVELEKTVCMITMRFESELIKRIEGER